MIKTITVDNFQSHSNTTIELNPMVNTIIGLSDSGKSGIIRAIRANLQRAPFYVKNGEFNGAVRVEFTDYNICRKVEMGKVKKCPSCKKDVKDFEKAHLCECGEFIEPSTKSDYYIEEDVKLYEKFGVSLPDFILDKTKIRPISFVDFEEDLNICNQHDDMFFVGKSYSGLRRNKILSSLIPDSEKIDVLIKTMSAENSKDKQIYEIAQNNIAELEPKLKQAKPIVDEYKLIIEEIRTEENSLRQITDDLSVLVKYKETIDRDFKKVAIADKIAPISNFIYGINTVIEQLASVVSDLKNITDIKTFIYKNKSKFDLKIEELDMPTVDAYEANNKVLNDIISIKTTFSIVEAEYNTTHEACNSFNEKLAKKIEEFESFVDKEAICPIIKDKYCDKCKLILKE